VEPELLDTVFCGSGPSLGSGQFVKRGSGSSYSSGKTNGSGDPSSALKPWFWHNTVVV